MPVRLAPRTLHCVPLRELLGMQRITPMLWFDNQAEEAANFNVSVFKNSKVKQITHYTGEEFPEKKGQVMTVSFELDGQEFTALNGGPEFKFTEAVSFVINCDTQEEIDYYWEKLTAGGGKEVECGWVADKYGLFWQGSAGKVFCRMGEGSGRAATGDARGVSDEEARSRKATGGICRKVICSISQLSTLLQQSNIKCLDLTPSPTPISDFSVSAFPLSPIRRWFR